MVLRLMNASPWFTANVFWARQGGEYQNEQTMAAADGFGELFFGEVEKNHSVLSELFLLGLTSSWEIQIFLFLFFTVFYVASMLGNILIMLTIISDHHLHSPMYFLLANLSCIDTGVSSIATPKMIYDLFRKRKVISLKGCIAQMFFIHTVGGTEMVLLIVMACDRYIAICKPLHYLNIMSLRMCISFVAIAWTIGLIHSVAQLAFVVNLPFCGPNKIDSFYCDFLRFIKPACTDTYRLEFPVTANSGLISTGTFFILIVSYIFILVTVHKHSSGGSSKALSTLIAHITVVVFFFGPCIICYVWPFPTLPIDKFLAIFSVVITPFMNPVIYTFRNKDMKVAMERLFLRALSIRQNSFSPSPRNSDSS
nr:olfactory receptor 4F3/4F16/4F29-like [Symphalangus syndactylus]